MTGRPAFSTVSRSRPARTTARIGARAFHVRTGVRLFATALLLLALAPFAHAAPGTIAFLGDSLTAGLGLADPSTEAYPALIQKRIDQARLHWKVINAGVSGDTTAGGLRRIDWVLRQPVDILVIALGGNDGLRGIDPAVTRANLKGIIDRARHKRPRIRIILAGMQMPTNLGPVYTRRFRAVFPEVAREKHCALVPFLLEGVGGVPRLNQSDGIHPTIAGQAIIARNVWAILRPML